ncbi:MAG: T9SS type A sorting domain-containing protein, partial [Rhodothermales bacterium]|nr:T9SS type A sorting domain-containing protein [Rhodothermales bacterium]
GTIYGGLEATTPNPGRFLDGGTSGPTNRAFHVRVRSLVSSPAEPGTEAAAVTVEAPYPNPFADAATVALRLRQSERVRIEVLDVLGRRVALLHDGPLAGDTRHAFRFDGGALPAGLYLVRVTGETFGEVRPVTRVR